jgi:hypothetical protein
MFKDFNNKIKGKRYQELSKPYRIILWLIYMPFGYVKGLSWYFVKRLRWEDVVNGEDNEDDDRGRISLGTCIGICVGMVQGDMSWYYTTDEVFRDDGSVISRSDKKGYFEKMFDFAEEKLIEIIDGKKIYD